MIEFSANLGFLWANLPLPDAIRAAKSAGFDAVECHWPYDIPASEVKATLDETGLSMLGLNTRRGDIEGPHIENHKVPTSPPPVALPSTMLSTITNVERLVPPHSFM